MLWEEKAILPLKFFFHDGHVKWSDGEGKTEEHDLSTVMKSKAAAGIYTALNTDYSSDLLERGFHHWANHKNQVPSSKLLVVTSGISQAKKALKYLGSNWLRAEIATSHETKAAHAAIDRFKCGEIDIPCDYRHGL